MTEVVSERERRPYAPEEDKRTDRLKKGRCGRAYCRNPARWVWTDARGANRHECNTHAGVQEELDDDERVRIGLRIENNGIIRQRLKAITSRRIVAGWQVVYDGGIPARMVWGQRLARV